MNDFRYSTAQIVVHWLSALLICFLLVTGTFVLSEMPNTPEKLGNLMIHAGLGAAVAALLITRVVLRLNLPSPEEGLNAGVLSQVALNLVIALMVFSGVMLAVQSQTIDAVLGQAELPEDYAVFMPRLVHGVVAKLAMVLIALHVVSVMVQHVVRKTGVLNRMRPGAAKSSTTTE